MSEGQEQETEVVVDQTNESVVEHESELTKRVDGLEANQGLTNLLNDPDVMAVLEAKKAGKTVVVSTEEPKPDPSLNEEVGKLTKELDEEDPNRVLLDSVATLIDTKFEEQNARIEAVETHARAGAQKDVSTAVAAARAKFSDFDTYKTEMVELSGELKTLSVDELYMITKTRAGDLDITKTESFSEKPTTQTSSRRTTVAKRDNVRHGRKGFKEMLAEALEKTPDEQFL